MKLGIWRQKAFDQSATSLMGLLSHGLTDAAFHELTLSPSLKIIELIFQHGFVQANLVLTVKVKTFFEHKCFPPNIS